VKESGEFGDHRGENARRGIGILSATFTLVGLPLSLLAFHLGIRWARITGTLSHF
jgi:hypothetical protein